MTLSTEYFISNIICQNEGKIKKISCKDERICRHHIFGARDVKRSCSGTSLVVQWLRLHVPNAGGGSSTTGWETKIPHAMGHSQKKKRYTLQRLVSLFIWLHPVLVVARGSLIFIVAFKIFS